MFDSLLLASVKQELKKEKDIEDTISWEPLNWRLLLSNIQKMREKRDAIVDGLGCERCSDEEKGTKVSWVSIVNENSLYPI